MEKKQREEVALFRFGVISDLVCSRLTAGEQAELTRRKSKQRWHIPYSGKTRIAESTIRRWIRLYVNSGRELSSLYPAVRNDRGKSRRVDEETLPCPNRQEGYLQEVAREARLEALQAELQDGCHDLELIGINPWELTS